MTGSAISAIDSNDCKKSFIWPNARDVCTICLPFKTISTCALCPCSKNLSACFRLVSWSCAPIFRLRRILFVSIFFPFCFCFFFSCSYLNFPKSRSLTTGGFSLGETSTRVKPFACAFSKATAIGTMPISPSSGSMSFTSGTLI